MPGLSSTPPLSLGSRWAIRADALGPMLQAERLLHADPEAARLAAAAARGSTAATRRAGGVAVIPLTGVITPRGSIMSLLLGGAAGGLMEFRAAFRDAVASPDVGSIVLDVDSPGGLIDRVPETAAEIRDARGSKPIVAVANTMAASAAYWLAAQADEVVATPSADVGSVGVYVVHQDWSAANEQAGIVPTYVHAGKYKVEGNPDEPLADETRAAWQVEVNELYAMFVGDLAAGRSTTATAIERNYGEGRTLMAARAQAAGMVDRVATIEEVIGEFLSPAGRGSATTRRALAGDAEQRADNRAVLDLYLDLLGQSASPARP